MDYLKPFRKNIADPQLNPPLEAYTCWTSMRGLLAIVFLSLCIGWPAVGSALESGKADRAVKGSPEKRDVGKPSVDRKDANPSAAVREVAEGIYVAGKVTINRLEGFVRLKGHVNMRQGLIEYLACGPRGKLHESLLSLDVEPINLQVALLLLGLKPGDKPLDAQGAKGVPQGDPVEIWVSWRGADNRKLRWRAEKLLWNSSVKDTMPTTHWIFTGSKIINGQFIAQVEQSIVASYHDPHAMFDHPLPTGTDDTLYYVNTQIVPPVGTPVTMTIRPFPEEPPSPERADRHK